MAYPSILIVGGGMAGLGLARALQARGIPFDIVERAEPAAGAGIFLPANAVRALGGLGVHGVGHPIVRQRIFDQRGRTLVDLPLTRIWGDVGASVAVERAELYRALVEGVPVTYGITYPADLRRHYDLVVGADGIRSALRGTPPRPIGLVAWRFVAEAGAGTGEWSAWQDRDRTFLSVSLGDGRAYCYADAAAVPAGDWRELFAHFPAPVPTLVAQGAAAHVAPIEEVDPVYPAGPGRVLIGDAAHAFSPNMAQGAALAFEDALVLAEMLGSRPAEKVVEEFTARRLPRAIWVRDNTHRRDRARHLPPPVRNAIFRVAGRHMIPAAFKPLRERP